jgi:serine/threonine protein kinase/tetratricopeptide (TPR) repeat protein/TolB-like protein
MSGRSDRIRELYEAALERPIGERSSFVVSQTKDDRDLRQRVEALLKGQHDTQIAGCESADGDSKVLATGTLIGQYRIDGPLGAGGMGVVYRATDTKLNRPAAIKVLPENLADSEARRRFQREAQMASSLNHPHIVTVYDAGEYQERQYLITEYVDGGTLRHWAGRQHGWRSIVELLIGVADAVAVAHEAGILHRDIKPENILLAKSGYAKLADFGLAKLLETDPLADDAFAGMRPDQHSSLVGTAAYMSPEQAQGLPLDARSDVYSFGLVLHELLSGQRPPVARPQQDDGGEVERLAPFPNDVPVELRTIVGKALEHEPPDRYQTMRELVVDLRRLARRSGVDVDSGALSAEALVTATALAKRRRNRNTIAIVGMLLIVGIGAVAGFYAFRPSPVSAVAVLPFENATGDSADSHINEGLGTELRRRLMELPGLRVQARASSVNVAVLGLDPRAIASRLDVGVLINGSLSRRGDTLIVLVEAIDSNGDLLATWTHEASDGELLLLESAIAADVIGFFAPNAQLVAAVMPTPQTETAHELVLRGTVYDQEVRDDITVDEEKLEAAIELYTRATIADPNSIEAHSRLAGALVYFGDIERATASLNAALDLVDAGVKTTKAELSDLYFTTALYLLQAQQPGVERNYRLSIDLNQNNADALGAYGQLIMTHRRLTDAEPYFAAALELDRERLSRYVDFAEYYVISESMDRVHELGDEIQARFPNARGDRALARLHEIAGELDIGIAYGLRAYRAAPEDPDNARQVAELYARIGMFDEAAEFDPETPPNLLYFSRDYVGLREETAELMIGEPNDLKLRYMLAFAHNVLNEPQDAKRILEGAGLPIDQFAEFRTGAIDEAMTTYIDALQAIDPNSAKARELAEKKIMQLTSARGRSWWNLAYQSCTQSQLGNIEQALAMIERIKLSKGLAMSPFLQDGLCFQRLAGDARYEGVIEHLKARQAEFRARLPATLQEYGVANVRAATVAARLGDRREDR